MIKCQKSKSTTNKISKMYETFCFKRGERYRRAHVKSCKTELRDKELARDLVRTYCSGKKYDEQFEEIKYGKIVLPSTERTQMALSVRVTAGDRFARSNPRS